MTARANYIIAAQDATKDAIRSIQSNFKSLDSGIKSTARGINLALGFLAGAGLKNLFRNALDATAEAAGKNSEFAQTLDDVRKSARDLMVPKTGLPGVTDNLKELAATLKDPAVVSAADALFSSLLRGGTAAVNVLAQTAAGIRILATGEGGNRAVDIDSQLRKIEGRAEFFAADQSSTGRRKYRELIREAQQLRIEYWRAVQGPAGEGLQNIDATGAMQQVNGLIDSQSAKFEAAAKAAEEYQDTVRELQKTLDTLPAQFAETASANVQETLKAQQETSEAAAKFFEETQERGKELAARGAEMTRQLLDETTEYARQAARNMQDALATFLFDPFHDGLKGMLRGFVDTIRKMVAEAAAAKIFGSKDKGGLGLGDFITTAVGSIFGGFRADGGPVTAGVPYMVGERGPEMFVPSSSGYIRPNGGGSKVENHFHIDARGAQEGVAAQIQRAIAQAAPMIVDASRRSIKDDLSRRAIR